MDAKQFWEIIDKANSQVSDWEELYEPLVDILFSLDAFDIMKWNQIFNEYRNLSYKNKLWAAAYVINGGCSDDGFDDFRGWLIAQGKEVFLNALNNPESLADVKACKGGSVGFEEMLSIAADACCKKMNIEQDYDSYYDELDKNPLSDAEKLEIASEIQYTDDIEAEWDDNSLKTLLPRLCDAFDW